MLDSNSILALVMAAALVACDDGVSPGSDVAASVKGIVETPREPAPAREPTPSEPQEAPADDERSVAVVQVQANGTFSELAAASVEADGSYEVHGVPAGRTELAVVAYAEGQVVGSVLIHEASRAGATIVAAPINHETSLETAAYTRLKAERSGGSASELALLVHVQGPRAEMVATSQAEIDAVAAGYVMASSATTSVYAALGASFDAGARAQALGRGAVQFAADRHAGMSLSAAHDAFTYAALGAYAAAGADLEQTIIASAAAASAFDAVLYGHSSARADVVAQAVRMNLRARERLATELSASAAASLANAIHPILAQARLALVVGTVLDLRGLVQTTADAAADVAIDAAVEMLAADASATIRADVRARAEAAVRAARLEARLDGATTAQAAASAVASYRASVRAAVEAMIASAGSSSVSADVVTALFIAACGSAYIR